MPVIRQRTLDNVLGQGARLNEALVEIRWLYLRSNKRDKHTCYQMYLVAVKALAEIEQADPPDAASVEARWGG